LFLFVLSSVLPSIIREGRERKRGIERKGEKRRDFICMRTQGIAVVENGGEWEGKKGKEVG